MPTVLLKHKRTGNMVGESHEGFFDLTIKRENFYTFGFSGWSHFIQREVPLDHHPVVLKI